MGSLKVGIKKHNLLGSGVGGGEPSFDTFLNNCFDWKLLLKEPKLSQWLWVVLLLAFILMWKQPE